MNENYGVSGATNPAKAKFVANAAARSYKGPSVVDYLSYAGVPNDPTSRTKLAGEMGVQNYSVNPGNASQNLDFLARLRAADSGATPSAPGTPTTIGGASGNLPPGYTPPTSVSNPNAPANTPEDPYKQAFSSYLQSLQMSPEETAAKKYLDTLVTDDKLAQEKALNTGETMGFATGEAQRVARNNAITIGGASANLNTLEGIRANQTSANKARLDFETAQANRAADQNKPFELSPGQERYQYNSKTGTYEKTASVAPKAEKRSTSLTEVNGNRVLVDDQTGEVIKNLGKSTTQSSNEDPIIAKDLKDAQAAIDVGADADAVRRRFLETHQNKGSLYNDYFGGKGVTF